MIYNILYTIAFFLNANAILVHLTGIYTIVKTRRHWKNQHLILLNLSVVSITFCLIQLPRTVYTYQIPITARNEPDRKLPIHYNRTNMAILSIQLEYILTIVIQTVDRLIAVTRPLRYHCFYTTRKCCNTIYLSWLCSVLALIVTLSTYTQWNSMVAGMMLIAVLMLTYLFVVASYIKMFSCLKGRNTRWSNEVKHTLRVPLLIILIYTIFYIAPSTVYIFIVCKLKAYYLNGVYVPVLTIGVMLDGIMYILYQGELKSMIQRTYRKYSSRVSSTA